jgi:5-methylcytosine-specific restriction enzyme subunit McrC
MIPIQNVYYLLAYAFRDLQLQPVAKRSAEPFISQADFMVHLLTVAVERLVTRGLQRNYIRHEEPIRGLKGKLDIQTTLRRQLQANGQTHCIFDEFHHDIIENQLLRGTLKKCLSAKNVSRETRGRAYALWRSLEGVRDIRPRDTLFSRLRANFNNRDYQFPLQLARLINRLVIINEEDGSAIFKDVTFDDKEMAVIFEQFLFNLLKREQQAYRVDRRHVQWHDVYASEHDLKMLPIMRTDIVLHDRQRLLVIDAKFYREALKGWYGTERLRSTNLYQIMEYVENIAPAVSQDRVDGMLLYPVTEARFSYDFRIRGRNIMIRSVDLAQDWTEIRHEILSLID